MMNKHKIGEVNFFDALYYREDFIEELSKFDSTLINANQLMKIMLKVMVK